ncbi:hypothetical protein MYX84_12380 [Acidobacteria bacterium AH-259-O06]|nr:hypothetical protein [Acidobacteria bacterium AH-259-O06]
MIWTLATNLLILLLVFVFCSLFLDPAWPAWAVREAAEYVIPRVFTVQRARSRYGPLVLGYADGIVWGRGRLSSPSFHT